MSVFHQEDLKTEYTTPARVQAWFLHKSRDNWKRKYMDLKADTKRLQNRVNDVTKSRAGWRDETKQLTQRVQELEAENAALRARLTASKKNGRNVGTGRVR
jgi:SMC interacting uncharacterized protein involved in chromosome segregation